MLGGNNHAGAFASTRVYRLRGGVGRFKNPGSSAAPGAPLSIREIREIRGFYPSWSLRGSSTDSLPIDLRLLEIERISPVSFSCFVED